MTPSFRRMLVAIFSRSRKIARISEERRRHIGAAIHSCATKEELVSLSISSLASSEAFAAGAVDVVANDILDERFDLLLLPERFDCEEVPRLGAANTAPPTLGPQGSRANANAGACAGCPQKQDQEDEEEECPVCLGSRAVQVATPCKHKFCRPCINSWMAQNGDPFDCPMCRSSTRSDQLAPLA